VSNARTPEEQHSATRRELETVARKILGETSDLASDAGAAAKRSGPAVAVLGAVLAFLWGRHRGKRRRAYVTVKRKR
jgi:hypothetical protein